MLPIAPLFSHTITTEQTSTGVYSRRWAAQVCRFADDGDMRLCCILRCAGFTGGNEKDVI